MAWKITNWAALLAAIRLLRAIFSSTSGKSASCTIKSFDTQKLHQLAFKGIHGLQEATNDINQQLPLCPLTVSFPRCSTWTAQRHLLDQCRHARENCPAIYQHQSTRTCLTELDTPAGRQGARQHEGISNICQWSLRQQKTNVDWAKLGDGQNGSNKFEELHSVTCNFIPI